ncbi:MAG: hypothetical protein ACKV0T_04105 [Planctomycetales bacterium]
MMIRQTDRNTDKSDGQPDRRQQDHGGRGKRNENRLGLGFMGFIGVEMPPVYSHRTAN